MPASLTAEMVVLLRGCDFNLFKHVFLKGPYLLQSDQFEEREKGDNHFDSGCSAAKQIRKTEASAGRDALQNRIDLFRHTKTFTEDLLHVLARFQSFHHRLESADQLENPNFAQAQRFLQIWRRSGFPDEDPFLFQRTEIEFRGGF